jgi:uncharacterized protein (TIGR02996 family)
MSEAAFLRTIRGAPADDVPRLVFADWLEEHGQPERGEFIRLQCRLAAWIPAVEERERAYEREAELLSAFGQRWAGALERRAEQVRWHRGLANVAIEPREWQRVLPQDRLWVQTVRLRLPADGSFQPAARQTSDILHLDLSAQNLSDDTLLALLASAYLAGVQRLDLRNNALSADPIVRLGMFGRVRELLVEGNPGALGGLPDFPAVRPPAGQFVNSLGMRFAQIPAGTFRMGSPPTERLRFDDEGPQHLVEITRPFWLGVSPVRRLDVAALHEYATAPAVTQLHHPQTNVSWDQARDFCDLLSARADERAAGRRYRLPTEAEWEHACRGGRQTVFGFGNALSPALANLLSDTSYGNIGTARGPLGTTPVGNYPPNEFGLFDMHGNVWEWCADWYQHYAYQRPTPAVDPQGPPRGRRRVLRGGSWSYEPHYCRSACRKYNDMPTPNPYVGFRVACDLTDKESP